MKYVFRQTYTKHKSAPLLDTKIKEGINGGLELIIDETQL